MKTHFVTKFTEPGSQVSFYRNGSFVDFHHSKLDGGNTTGQLYHQLL